MGHNYDDIPQGYILNDAGMYSYVCQDVYPDLLSFMAAIPAHLQGIFLIPLKIDIVANHIAHDGMIHVASRLSRYHFADEISPSGNTNEADLFGTKTFVYDDNSPTVAPSDSGSIFDIDGADERTHHQDLVEEQDTNEQPWAETTFNSDVDLKDSGFNYPYRTDERPLRHSSEITIILPRKIHLALEPQELESRTPENIEDNATSCSVSLTSYDKKSQMFTFSVQCGGADQKVQAKLSDLHHVALNCSCEFWRWNGPEYHAAQNDYLLGTPHGTAEAPDVRDPERKFHLCKHTFAVVARLDSFVEELQEEHWGEDDQQILEEVDNSWDRMESVAEIPLEEVTEDEAEAEITEDVDELEDSEESDEEIEDSEESDEEIAEDEEDEVQGLDLADQETSLPPEAIEADDSSSDEDEDLEIPDVDSGLPELDESYGLDEDESDMVDVFLDQSDEEK